MTFDRIRKSVQAFCGSTAMLIAAYGHNTAGAIFGLAIFIAVWLEILVDAILASGK